MSNVAPAPVPERQRDADRSQAAILSAAQDEFAELGFDGARMDAIAKRAQVNKRLIYYYFRDKDQLFQAVLEKAYQHIRSAEQKLNLLSLSPPDAVRRLVEFTWNYSTTHPEFQSLLNSANVHKARHLRQSRARELNSPVVDTLGRILEQGRRDGIFRGGIDPTQLYISIAALTFFYLSNNHTLSAIFDRQLLAPKARQERLTHMCDLILGYVMRD
ncbi:TetR/AcrR family transcriptional regulator [uncultured Castellaniella sp.]|jgi:AcrR family transcriptional regulator|uniref:TetR/AcrR family transcriptional regulator n=1 Tax=uncultured Castellaniella sp. TaxID=647907 RepID=UPI002634AA60|nr:TetR/AcrR family transcriptional regulator [uncultured Castellaniella sp.]